jgi:hypothetical protein
MSGKDNEGDDETPGAEIIAWPKTPLTRPPAPRPTPEGPRDEAEALVVKALASITGREPDDIIREIRARESGDEGGDADDDHTRDEAPPENVIDLNAVREARQGHAAAHEANAELGELFRAGFRAVMDELSEIRPGGGELVIDAAFMREHGPRLLGSVFSSLGRAFLAKNQPSPEPEPLRPAETASVETPNREDTTDEPSDFDTTARTESAAERHARPVEIRVDFGSLAMTLLSRLGVFGGRASTPPPAPPTPEPEATDSAKEQEDAPPET